MRIASFEELYGVSLTPEQKHQMRVYLEWLLKWNPRLNLTSMKRVEDLIRWNFFESFWLAETFLQGAGPVVDVGSGGGFPGLAAKLYRPELNVTLVEPGYKKVVFLTEVSRAVGLRVEIFAGKGEDYLRWDQADLAIMRALRLSRGLRERLATLKRRLLLLHGEGLGEEAAGLEVLRQAKVPGSLRRYATLMQC